MKRLTCTIVTTALLALGAACGGGDEEATPTTTSSTTNTSAVGRVDWQGGSTAVTLANGWVLRPCESGPRQLCVRNGEVTEATIELNDYPVVTFPKVQAVLDAGGNARKALEVHATEYVATFTRDRREGCGDDYRVRPLPVTPARFGARTGITFGFDGVLDGRKVEHNRQWTVLEGDSIFLLTATAIEEGTCLHDDELATFSISDLDAVESELARVFAASPLPKPLLCATPGNPAPVPCP